MIFARTALTWFPHPKLFSASGHTGEGFGSSVAFSNTGLIAVIGVPYRNYIPNTAQGVAYVVRYNSGWEISQSISRNDGDDNDFFGRSVAISGDYIIIGSWADRVTSTSLQGSATIYVRNGGLFQRYQFVADPSNEGDGDFFGMACSIDATTGRFIIGAPGFYGGRGKVVFGKIN